MNARDGRGRGSAAGRRRRPRRLAGARGRCDRLAGGRLARQAEPDPLRRLHLDRLPAGKKGEPKAIDPTAVGRTSLPARSGVQEARVEHGRPRPGGRGLDRADPRMGGRGQGCRPFAGGTAARRTGPGRGPDRPRRRPASALVAGRTGAAVGAAGCGGGRPALVGRGLPAGLPAAAAAAGRDLGPAASADRAGARWCPGRPAAGRSEPDRRRGRSDSARTRGSARPCGARWRR